MFDNPILILFVLVLGISLVAIILKNWEWMPVILLPILWYVPRQTAPGGLLENYIILRWTTVIIIPFIIFIQFIRIVSHSKPVKFSRIALPLGIFVLVYFLSGVLNHCSLWEILGSLILYIKYPLLFMVLINMDITKKVIQSFTRLFLFLVLLQIPECIYRGLVMSIRMDNLSWTLGPWGTLDLGIYMIYTIAIFSAYVVVKRINLNYIIMSALFFVIALLGEIKAFLFSAPIVAIFSVYGAQRQKQMKFRLVTLLFPLILLVLFYLVVNNWHSYYGKSDTLTPFLQNLPNILKNPFLFFESQEVAKAGHRISGGFLVWNYLSKNFFTLLFGLGPGSSLAGGFFGTPGRLFSLNLPALNQIGAILGEVGLIGFIVYFWMLIILFRIILKANAIMIDTNLYILSAALIGMWVYYAILGPFYDLVWRHDASSYIFYFYAAVVYKHFEKTKLIS